MINKRRRTMAATDLRVHLGEALRSLDDADIVIEKGGVPVAILTRYAPPIVDVDTSMDPSYLAALSKRAEPDGILRAISAMRKGIPDWDSEKLIADMYAAREAGTKTTYYTLDDDGEMVEAESGGHDEIPARQRRLHRSPEAGSSRVAEERTRFETE
jgi:hypothetical protein